MSEPIPTTDDIRGEYASDEFGSVPDWAADFDRWLAAHDAEVARKERERIAEFLSTPGVLWHGNDGVTVYADGAYGGNRMKLTDWLRAEQIGENHAND